MILVTGAAGKTGQAAIRALVGKGQALRALVHRPEQVGVVQALGAGQVVVGDLRQRPTLDEAMQGVRAVYHICPNMHPEEVAIGRLVIAAARAAGVELFVYHSVLHPQVEAMPHHWLKLRVEEQLFEAGLPYTILQPTAYMQNVSAHWETIVQQGIYPVPYAVETRLGLVDLEDVAQAAATVLAETAHEGATYELAGAEVLSQSEIAAVLGQRLGRSVQAEKASLDAWEQQARQAGLGDYQVETLCQMFRYYECYGFWGNPRVLSGLLGRPPTSFATFVDRTVRERLAGASGGD
jgi:uncharacterized protein YbjT (DUF2867 family)